MSESYGSYQPESPQAYGQPYPMVPHEHPQGTTILVLGILGFFVGVCAPFAWYLGSKALKESRASGVFFANEQSIVVGRVLGMVVTILALIGLAIALVFLAIVVVAAVSSGS